MTSLITCSLKLYIILSSTLILIDLIFITLLIKEWINLKKGDKQ